MIVEIKIPSPGESITDVQLSTWLVADGDIVHKNQEIAEVESDKATLPLIAPEAGKVKISIAAGETIKVGAIACTIDTEFASQATNKMPENKEVVTEIKKTPLPEEAKARPIVQLMDESLANVKVTPVAQKMMEENGISVDEIISGLRKINKEDVQAFLSSGTGKATSAIHLATKGSRDIERLKMTSLRKKLSQRLVAVKNETAMLTTFNELDMSEILSLRKHYQDQFLKKYGLKLGFMSFFTKAVTEALQMFPSVNSMIEGDEIVYHKFCDVCIAVQTPKGLMVPVVRNTESLTVPEIEIKIAELAAKARSNRITVEEMTGGTFTITNGGIYGSLMSTPIINPPQSAILGMHNIVERPIAVNGKVEIRPMMYIALSYDHRAIDGKDSVSFLFKVKELLESPWKLYSHGQDIGKALLDL